jgi:hypothetical protein
MESATHLRQDDAPSRPSRSRLSVSLTGEILAAVEDIAAIRGIEPGEVVRQAITHEHYYVQQQAEGMVLKGHWPDGEVARIVFAGG